MMLGILGFSTDREVKTHAREVWKTNGMSSPMMVVWRKIYYSICERPRIARVSTENLQDRP